MTVKELLLSGKLQEAVQEATNTVRQKPFDVDARSLLVECLILAGELERADKQLDTIAYQHPETLAGVALLRQLIRAETARQQFYTEGRIPDFIDKPAEDVEELLRASIFLREGEIPSAQEIYEKVEDQRVASKGSCNGEPFEDFRDLDDRLGSVIEVLTSTGKYYWVPISNIRKIEFRPIERPLDLKWRRAFMETTRDDLEGEIYIPGIYFNQEKSEEDNVKLGRITDWQGSEEEPYRGIGQRMFLVGDDAVNLTELQSLEFEHA